jgi:hypothetical protein
MPLVAAVTLAATVASVPSVTTQLTVQLIRRCPPAAVCAPPVVIVEMKREAERIWQTHGVLLSWYQPSSIDRAGRPVPELVVMLEENPHPVVEGSRKADLVLGRLHRPETSCDAGVAHIWVGHVRRHTDDIHVNGIPLISAPTRFAQFVFARALGRTLAHEIGHYLLGGAHSAHGLMRAQFTSHELLENPAGHRYDIDDNSRRILSQRSDQIASGCVTPADSVCQAPHP